MLAEVDPENIPASILGNMAIHTTTSSEAKAQSYASSVTRLAREHPRFKLLHDFCGLQSAQKSKVTVIDFPDSGAPVFKDVTEDSLGDQLCKSDNQQLVIVENLSPVTLCTLGGLLDVDPQFFFEHIDAVPADTRPRLYHRSFEPRPWYTYGNVAGHIPSLRSLDRHRQHVHLKFVGAREHSPIIQKVEPYEAQERRMPDMTTMNIERVVGRHVPMWMSSRGVPFNLALIRQTISVWFDRPGTTQPGFTKGIILVDPPFEDDPSFRQYYGQRMNSAYRPLLPLDSMVGDSAWRHSCKESIEIVLQQTFKGTQRPSTDCFNPIRFLEAPLRLAVSEFLVVSTYIERDLGNIAWRLSDASLMPTSRQFQTILTQLFTLQRRVAKYASHIEHIQQTINSRMPESWSTYPSPVQGQVTNSDDPRLATLKGMREDAAQAKTMMDSNAEQISRTIKVITSLINAREGEESSKQTREAASQSRRVTFLTIIAALALPFNTVASILGIQTDFGPNGELQGWLWGFSGGIVALIALMYGFVLYKDRSTRALPAGRDLV